MLLSKRSSYRLGACPKAFLACLALLCMVCCSDGSSASGADASRKEGAEEKAVRQLFPVVGEAGDWRPGGAPAVFRGEALFEHIDGGADIYFEYGFVTLLVERYKNGDKDISVEIYCMDDAPAAFGIYSYNRHPTLSAVEVGGDGTIHPSGLFFRQGRYFVDIRRLGAGTILKEEFLVVAKAIEKKIGATAESPAVVKLLPREHMVERSEVFARGPLAISNQVYVAADDLFGLAKGEVAVIARYRLGLPEFSVIIAQYASDDACADAFARLRDHFLGDASVREEQFIVTAMPGKHHAVRKAGSKLVVVANADTPANALAMLERVSDSVEAG